MNCCRGDFSLWLYEILMFLDYVALAALIIGLVLVFYTFVFIHDLPHEIAKKRNHPHADAIGVALG